MNIHSYISNYFEIYRPANRLRCLQFLVKSTGYVSRNWSTHLSHHFPCSINIKWPFWGPLADPLADLHTRKQSVDHTEVEPEHSHFVPLCILERSGLRLLREAWGKLWVDAASTLDFSVRYTMLMENNVRYPTNVVFSSLIKTTYVVAVGIPSITDQKFILKA